MEVTTLPLGEEIAKAVGLVLVVKHLVVCYNKPKSTIVDHYTCCISDNGYSFILQYQLCKIEAEQYESADGGVLQF